MAFTLLPDKSAGDVFTEGLWDSIKDNLNFGVMRPVSDTVLSVAASSVDLSPLPTGFQHLVVMVTGRSSVAATSENVRVRLNGDTGANYDYQAFTAGSAMTAAEAYAANQVTLAGVPGSTSPAGRFAMMEVWLPNYGSTDNQKSLLVTNPRFRTNTTTDFALQYVGGWWRSSAAVTSMEFSLASGQFAVGSRFTLYGLGALSV